MTRIFVTLFVLLFSVNALAQNDRDYIRRGNRLVGDSLYDKAQVQYQKAVEFDNTNPRAHYNLGFSLMLQSKAEDAIKEYETAARLEKNKERKAQMYHNMGWIFQSSKQFDKAIQCYKNSLRNNPNCDETRYNYALCLYQMDKNGDGESQDQDENGEDEKKEQQQQEQKEKQKKENEQAPPKQNESEMSRENAEQMLNAAMQDEKATQEKLQKAMQNPNKKQLEKQW